MPENELIRERADELAADHGMVVQRVKTTIRHEPGVVFLECRDESTGELSISIPFDPNAARYNGSMLIQHSMAAMEDTRR